MQQADVEALEKLLEVTAARADKLESMRTWMAGSEAVTADRGALKRRSRNWTHLLRSHRVRRYCSSR
jgi:hypothetical protein